MVKEEGKFKWLQEGVSGQPIILLHGLMGGVENFGEMVDFISEEYVVYGLDLKLFEGNLLKVSVKALSDYLYDFMSHLNLDSAVLIGNSMGGHIGLIFTKEHPEKVDGLILTGSSGLFEESMGSSFPRRGDKDYIRAKTEEVFYDPKVATDDLVDRVFEIANNRISVLKLLGYAKSAIRHNMADDIPNINKPVCLVWGADDKVTPPHVAEEFHKLLPDSELNWIPLCGHAAMWEHPKRFSEIVLQFLKEKF
ncbi:MAG: alpha/beta hydrolase [Flavobacteriales bacterium]|nr:alpha/beta hydrolase [Flavobacteriales bacterium]|tara:strand:- start:19530 stop:20282 length:753 start_codon:yes stop_codon:yes gene_type:complete